MLTDRLPPLWLLLRLIAPPLRLEYPCLLACLLLLGVCASARGSVYLSVRVPCGVFADVRGPAREAALEVEIFGKKRTAGWKEDYDQAVATIGAKKY